MSETILFIKGFFPYLIIYTLVFASILATVAFFLSAWLAKKDGTDFHYRKEILADYLKYIHDIKFFIKEKETLKWINEENENKNNRMNELIYLKDISTNATRQYLKKGILSLLILALFIFVGNYIYTTDVKKHQPSVFYSQYDNMENIDNDKFSIKIEPHNDYKEVTVIDKEQRMEYYYTVENSNNHIKNVYYSQSIIMPSLLKNVFAICYVFILISIRYFYKIMF